MDAVEKVARALDEHIAGIPVALQGDRDTVVGYWRSEIAGLLAAFPQLALEGREEWEYAQAIPSYGYDDEQNGWHVGKSFHGDPNRALDEGYTLVRRALGPWSEVQS